MSKTKKVEVSKIALQIGKKKIELSLDEARELQQILADLLGLEIERKYNRITVIPAPPAIVVPYPVPAPLRRYDWWEVKPIWTDTTGTIAVTSVRSQSSSGDIIT